MSKQQRTEDLFGRENQGGNYDKFRPRYPEPLLQMIMKHASARGTYLDVCCGTGQLLLPLSNSFSTSIGTDLSNKQLSSIDWNSHSKTQQNNQLNPSIKVFESDAHKLPELFEKNQVTKAYDLITIGQALHWLDVDVFLEMIAKKLMKNEASVFAVAAYYCSGFDITNKQTQEKLQGDDLYEEFYNRTKLYYDFNRQDLFGHYASYNFNKCFNEIEAQTYQQVDNFDIEGFMKYLRTSSAYNTLYEKESPSKGFIDPISTLTNNICTRANSSFGSNPIISIARKTSYFLKIFKRI